MEKLFDIPFANAEPLLQPVLNILCGEKHFAAAVTDQSSGELKKLLYFADEEGIQPDSALEVLDQEFSQGQAFYQVRIGYDYSGSALVPSGIFRQDDADGLQPYHPYGAMMITEQIPEWQLYNVYPVPSGMHRMLTGKFPAASFRQQFTITLKTVTGSSEHGLVLANIRRSDFSILVIAAGHCILAAAYEYQTPDDIIYQLMRVLDQFQFSQKSLQLRLSGLIDKESALYRELFQYFEQISFREAQWKNRDPQFPAHYFTSLNDIFQCAL